jgi:hypothetical protein
VAQADSGTTAIRATRIPERKTLLQQRYMPMPL